MRLRKWWIVLGDTRVKIETWEQLAATCRLFNLTLPDCEDDTIWKRKSSPSMISAGAMSTARSTIFGEWD